MNTPPNLPPIPPIPAATLEKLRAAKNTAAPVAAGAPAGAAAREAAAEKAFAEAAKQKPAFSAKSLPRPRPLAEVFASTQKQLSKASDTLLFALPDGPLADKLCDAESQLRRAVDHLKPALTVPERPRPTIQAQMPLLWALHRLRGVLNEIAKSPLSEEQARAVAGYRGAVTAYESLTNFTIKKAPDAPYMMPQQKPLPVAIKAPPLDIPRPRSMPEIFAAAKDNLKKMGGDLYANMPDSPEGDRLFLAIAKAQAAIATSVERFAPGDGKAGRKPTCADMDPLIDAAATLRGKLEELSKQPLDLDGRRALARYKGALYWMDMIIERGFMATYGAPTKKA